MEIHSIIAVTLLICFIGIAESNYTSVVQTTKGPVRGKIAKTLRRNVEYASFQGIPYAKPPESELRFQPPVEIENWSEVFDAYQEGSVCVQIKNSSILGSENCLFLNVYTPCTSFTKIDENNLKPVMVWIHGGAYAVGSGNYKGQGPDFILEEDVIMVSMNYRLGPLGFLNLKHKNASGNMALKDQSLALKWVKMNIAKFGGDPNQITIFGQSAGSVCVDYHILSDMSAGLFNQSIGMSGSALDFLWGIQSGLGAFKQAKLLASKLGSKAKTAEEILKVLKAASAEDIIRKSTLGQVIPFRPTVERVSDVNNEKFLSKCAVDKYRSGDYNKGPHMMGFTSREIKVPELLEVIGKVASKNKNAENNSSGISNDTEPQQFSVADKFLSTIEEIVYPELSKSLSNLFFATGIDSKQKMLLKHNKHPIYYYRFSFESDLPEQIFNRHNSSNSSGVRHSEDLVYLFYMSPLQLRSEDSGVQLIINQYVRLMTNFAKHGNPTPNGNKDDLLKINWPNSGRLGLHLEINKKLTVGLRPTSLAVYLEQVAGIGKSRLLNFCY